jgi:hypothetical protein
MDKWGSGRAGGHDVDVVEGGVQVTGLLDLRIIRVRVRVRRLRKHASNATVRKKKRRMAVNELWLKRVTGPPWEGGGRILMDKQ